MTPSTTQAKGKNRILSKITAVVLPCLFWLGAWQFIAMYVGRELLVASPKRVFTILRKEAGTAAFWKTIGMSLLRIFRGFSLAVILSVPTAVLTARVRPLYLLIHPVISVIRATPVASFILFLLIWCKNRDVPSIITFLMVFPIVWTRVSQGIDSVDPKLTEVGKIFRLSRRAMVKDIYAPQVLPYFAQAVITSLGLAWKSGIAAEVLCTPPDSIGKMIYNARVYLETPELFAWTLTVIVISMLFERLITSLLSRLGLPESEVKD